MNKWNVTMVGAVGVMVVFVRILQPAATHEGYCEVVLIDVVILIGWSQNLPHHNPLAERWFTG